MKSKITGQRMPLMIIAYLVLIAGCVYVIILGYFYFAQSGFIYFPSRLIETTPADAGMKYENVKLKTSDGIRLGAWFIPAVHRKGTLLFCHGNAGNISHRLDSIRMFYSLGLDILIFDYRGYGESEGNPSEKGTYLDVEAAYRWLTVERKVPAYEIIIFGRSLGGAVASQLAMDAPAGALIIESAFSSVPDLARELYPLLPVKLISRFKYDTKEHAGRISVPVLIIHSRNDEIVPFSHSVRIFDQVRAKKEFIEIMGDHNSGFMISSEIYLKGIAGFIERNLSKVHCP